MRQARGFTLIELLIVLAILSILIGVVAMSISTMTDATNARGMAAEMEIVQAAIDIYNAQDVRGHGAAAIGARTTAAVIETDDADAPFAKYIEHPTYYRYTWGPGGANLAVHE